MIRAEYKDLLLERWLRRRNSGELRWITREGYEYPISEMSDEHLENAIKSCERYEDTEYLEFLDKHEDAGDRV